MARFEAGDFDIVLLDVMLPDGDGRDVLRELRRVSHVPVVFLTARGEAIDASIRRRAVERIQSDDGRR